MEIRLLGPVEVWSEGKLVDAGSPRQRCVLAVLTVDAGRTVLAETLVDRVWGNDPPRRVRDALYVYISRIRRLIGEDAGARILRRSHGYVLDIESDLVDVARFHRAVQQAGDPSCPDERRLVLLRDAMDLWRGTPLDGLGGEWAQRVRARWQQAYFDAVLAWAQVELRVGNGSRIVGPLTELTDRFPLTESLVAALMRALHAVGRSADALDCYARIRRRLAEELGVDPGAELRATHQEILRGTPNVPARRRVFGNGPPLARPAQLPSDVCGFTGRANELNALDALLPGNEKPPTAAPICVISGTAGVGKTALAVHFGHTVADRFPDGQLYVNLRGFDASGVAMPATEAVRGFLDALDVSPDRVPHSPHAQAALYRSLLSGKKTLVLLDNARDAEQVRPLLPGTAGCFVIVTSRNQLTGLVATDGAYPLPVKLLSTAEAKELLSRRLGTRRVDTQPRAVVEITTRCARLPLALVVVIAHAATQPTTPLATLATALRNAHSPLDTLVCGDASADVRTVFSWSYQQLDHEEARLFRLLGLHAGPEITTPAAASLAGLTIEQCEPLLARLATAHLITEPARGRYTLHDLLRGYAKELASALDSDAERHTALRRVLDHYLHTADSAARVLEPHRESPTLDPCPTTITRADVTSLPEALAWFSTEHPVLMAAIRTSHDHGLDTHTWQLARTLTSFASRQGHWHQHVATQQVALSAAQRLADPCAEATAHHGLGRGYLRLGDYDHARTHLSKTLDLYRELDDPVGQARAHNGLSFVLARQGQLIDALRHSQRSLELFAAAGHQSGHATVLNQVGWNHALIGDYDQALIHCQKALTLLQELGDEHGQGCAWDTLGYAHHHLGHHDQATSCFRQALHRFDQQGERYLHAETLSHLADTYHATGNTDAARKTWHQALTTFEELGHADADTVRTKLRQLDQQQV